MERRSTTPNGGNHQDDNSLTAIEGEDQDGGFHFPGTSAVGTVGTSNAIESDDHIGQIGLQAGHASLDGPESQTPFELQGLNPGYSTVPLGQRPRKANLGNIDFENVEGENMEDLAKNDIVKQENTRLASVDDYMNLFRKESNDSQLYYRGYMDAMDGKPLDEDLALLSDDYYHGYEQAKFYNKTPLQSVYHNVQGIKENVNPVGGHLRPEEADRGPNELTDGSNRATAAAGLPVDVLMKFFEV